MCLHCAKEKLVTAGTPSQPPPLRRARLWCSHCNSSYVTESWPCSITRCLHCGHDLDGVEMECDYALLDTVTPLRHAVTRCPCCAALHYIGVPHA